MRQSDAHPRKAFAAWFKRKLTLARFQLNQLYSRDGVQQPVSSLESLKAIGGLSAIAFAYVFTAGFLYLAAQYEKFEIDLWTLDLPAYIVPAVSILTFKAKLFVLLPIWVYLCSVTPFSVAIKRLVVFVSLVVGSVLLMLTAINAGGEQANRIVQNPTPVHLLFSDDSHQKFEPKMLEANKSGRLALLTQTKDLVIVFDRLDHPLRIRNVYTLSRSDLSSISVGVGGETVH